jgi:hypothetical protein
VIVPRRPSRWRGLGDINTVAQTIQKQEGWLPGSVSQRNNNPGNLKCAGQPGLVGCDPSGFAIFPDYSTGYQALQNQITLDASRGLSIADFMAKYAPASDSNDPAGYAAKIAAASGLSVSDPLSLALGGSSAPSTGDLTGTQDASVADLTPLYIGGGLLAGAVLLSFIV